MWEKLTEDELEFLESFYDPVTLAECLFSNYDNLTVMEDEKLSHIRLGQLPLLSYEYLYDDDPKLSDQENFKLRKGAGDLYCLGGRLFGKTLCSEKIDLLISMCLLEAEKVGFSSYDAIHIRGVLEEIILALENHPFLSILKAQITRSPNYRISLPTGYLLEGINMNLTGKRVGAQFFQKHLSRLYMEEASFETEQVYKQRRDSVSELGCVYRISGMTDFTRWSPCGQVFYDLAKRAWVLNLPQYINPNWGSKAKQQAIKDFGGESSLGFRIFIEGRVVEEGISAFDMDRVRLCYDEEKKVKLYEITKDTYLDFEQILFLERPTNVSQVFVNADIGESAPTEIAIFFRINDKFRYVYNITLYNLTDKEQFRIFKYIGESIEANYTALDCTDGTGRAIFRSLAEIWPKENLVWCAFNEKIPIDYEKTDDGKIVSKEGKPVYKEEYVIDWSIKHLRDLFYNGILEIPLDYKLDKQLNGIKSMKSVSRTVYVCIYPDDHLFQAFQVFSISHWSNEFNLNKPLKKKDFCKTGV